jgi:hypothetical protein
MKNKPIEYSIKMHGKENKGDLEKTVCGKCFLSASKEDIVIYDSEKGSRGACFLIPFEDMDILEYAIGPEAVIRLIYHNAEIYFTDGFAIKAIKRCFNMYSNNGKYY